MSENQPNYGQNSDATTPASAWSSAPTAPSGAPAEQPATGSAAEAAPQSTSPAPAAPASPWQYQTNPQQTTHEHAAWQQSGGWHTSAQPTQPLPGHPAYPGQPQPGQPGHVPPWAGGTAPAVHPQPAPRRGGKMAIAAVAIAVLAGGVGTVGGYMGASLHDNGTLANSANPITKIFNAAPSVDRSSLADIAAAVQPSVVVVSTDSGEGSGVIMTADGYVLTNNHVVEGANGGGVTVTYSNGTRVKASVVGTDPRTDVAVVKIDGGKDLKAAKFGDSDGVRVGDTVLAIGSPLGLQGSVSAGIVSALHRTISENGQPESPFDNGGSAGAQTTIGDAIQTDAAINPGNSGGALVNTNGEVIGINTAIATNGGSSGNIGVGFAISANKAKSVAEQLMKGGKVTHPFLGVSVGDADSGGAQVGKVTAGSPADKAGIKVGDVITKIGNDAIANSEDLVGAVQGGTVGESVQVIIVRDGKAQTVSVVLGDAPTN